MKSPLCLAALLGLVAFVSAGAANAAVGGTAVEAARPSLSVTTMIQEAKWHKKKRHCRWHHHKRHCWWK